MTKEEIIKASVAYNERNGKLRVFGGSAILSDDEYFAFNKNPDFIAGVEWAFSHLWKDAQGDDLPEYEREVIALVSLLGFFQISSDEPVKLTYKVVFAHRPNPLGWNGMDINIDTKKVEIQTAMTFGKGGWNIPDVKYWLDCELPKKE